jgi:hypothetical protein
MRWERIARDSADDHWTVVEVLTAFVREHSPEAAQDQGPQLPLSEEDRAGDSARHYFI